MLNEKQAPLARIFNFTVRFMDYWVDESFRGYGFNDDSNGQSQYQGLQKCNNDMQFMEICVILYFLFKQSYINYLYLSRYS